MIKISVLPHTDEAENSWNNFASAHQGSIYHHTYWRHLIKDVFGHQSHYLFAADEHKQVIGILPLIQLKSLFFGNYLVSMPYFNYGGCIAINPAVAETLLKESEKVRSSLGCSHVEIRSIQQMLDLENPLPERIDKVAMILDLPDNPDDLWKSIGAKRRSQTKRPIREGVEFEWGGAELIDDFYHVFSINMRDLGTPVYSKSFFKAIFKWFPDQAKIAIVRLKDEAVGAGFLLGDGKMMEIPWASTLRKVNKIGVNMFLYWNILKSTIELDYQTFDFGRSSKDSGTLRFKKQWGAEERQLFWYYQLTRGMEIPILNHTNVKYNVVIKLWKKMPVSFCNVIGPHIIKGIP